MGKMDANAGLIRAIADGDASRVKELIRAGASISARFSLAVGSPLLANLQVREKLDENLLCNIAPLHMAAIAGQAEISEILIAAGASPKDRGGSCPNDYSGGFGGRDVNVDARFGYHPLHYAALADSPDVARILLAHGANMEEEAFFHRRPLHVACRFRSHEMIRFLVLSGAKYRVHAILPGEAISALCAGESREVLRQAVRDRDWVKWRQKHIALGKSRMKGPTL